MGLLCKQGILVGILACISACSSVALPYQNNSALTREEAKILIRRVFEEQPEKLRPIAVEVGDDAIRLGSSAFKTSFVTGATAAVDRQETYYFENLAPPELLSNKGRIVVKLSNREASVQRWVYVFNAERGGEFISAVQRLRRKD